MGMRRVRRCMGSGANWDTLRPALPIAPVAGSVIPAVASLCWLRWPPREALIPTFNQMSGSGPAQPTPFPHQ
jgi:hypothetical protein